MIERAVAALKDGGLAAFPTDTLYALGARATDDAAVSRVFEVKGRGDDKPLPLFVTGLEMAATVCFIDERARRLAGRFWPGALTIVCRRRPDFHSLALAGGDTVALRTPDHPIALAVIEALGEPVTATSANLSGGPDPVTAEEVRRQLGDSVDFVLDGGPCPLGAPSTIVDCSGDEVRILRPGAIPEAEVFTALSGAAERP